MVQVPCPMKTRQSYINPSRHLEQYIFRKISFIDQSPVSDFNVQYLSSYVKYLGILIYYLHDYFYLYNNF